MSHVSEIMYVTRKWFVCHWTYLVVCQHGHSSVIGSVVKKIFDGNNASQFEEK
jgi:hypothetical protein